MTVAADRGWTDSTAPCCAGCCRQLTIRGDGVSAVLVGAVLECEWEEGTWLAHFHCRRDEWQRSVPTDDPTIRVMHAKRRYRLLSDQLDYWLKDPQVAYCRSLDVR